MKSDELMIIHSFDTDCLDEDHPLAHDTVFCKKCGKMLHAENNETMTEWVEFQDAGALCMKDFAQYVLEVWKGNSIHHPTFLEEFCSKSQIALRETASTK